MHSIPVDRLIDVTESKQRTGRPLIPILREVTQACYDPEDGSDLSGESRGESGHRLRYRCRGVKKSGGRCPVSWGSRTQGRILKHAKTCPCLTEEQREAAGTACAKVSPVVALEEVIAREKSGAAEPQPKRVCIDVAMKGVSDTVGQSMLNGIVVQAGNRINLQNQLDGVITVLVCTGGIPPRVADSEEWKHAWILASNNKYKPPSSNTLSDTLIPSEAARINQKVITLLHSKDVDYATMGFDGGATSGHDSFTSVHATTSDRRALFLGGESMADIRHTGENYAEILRKVTILDIQL